MSGGVLWTVEAMASAMRARARGVLPATTSGLSIDTRTIGPGETFFAITGDARDGHDFVAAALQAGAGLAVVSTNRQMELPPEAPLLIVDDVLDALRDLARASRARTQAKVIAVTGSVGKTGTKDALALVFARQGATHASVASYNNHWGVPLSLARCPQGAEFAIFEMGRHHAGEIAPLSQLVRPQVAIITTVEPVHLEFFPSVAAIADAKAEIFSGLMPGGAAVINRDNPHFARLRTAARAAGVTRIVSFGEHAEADARLDKVALHPDCSAVSANILGTEVTYKIGAPGRHVVLNSLAVLATVALLEADLALAALALAELAPPAGRGARQELTVAGGSALLIDESYNANPASMRAALALLGQVPMGPRGRRIAVLGDMLELGPEGRELHRALVEPVLTHNVDLVFCSGPLMLALWEALPSERRGGYAETAAELESVVIGSIHAGDAVMVKGSLGSKMGPIVKALTRKYSPQRPAAAAAQG
jgi:UDP-N-acetylmuramoyl-tripeptide--D-alanyl-D-alanine ligase